MRKIWSTSYCFHYFLSESCLMAQLMSMALRRKVLANDKVLINGKNVRILNLRLKLYLCCLWTDNLLFLIFKILVLVMFLMIEFLQISMMFGCYGSSLWFLFFSQLLSLLSVSSKYASVILVLFGEMMLSNELWMFCCMIPLLIIDLIFLSFLLLLLFFLSLSLSLFFFLPFIVDLFFLTISIVLLSLFILGFFLSNEPFLFLISIVK